MRVFRILLSAAAVTAAVLGSACLAPPAHEALDDDYPPPSSHGSPRPGDGRKVKRVPTFPDGGTRMISLPGVIKKDQAQRDGGLSTPITSTPVPAPPVRAPMPAPMGGTMAPAPPPPDPNFDMFQQRNLDTINAYRMQDGVPPLTLDRALSDFAVAGSQELSQDHDPHAHFISENGGGASAETQGDPNGWFQLSADPTQDLLLGIDSIIDAWYSEGPGGGHHDAMVDPSATLLGSGPLEAGAAYLTNDFM